MVVRDADCAFEEDHEHHGTADEVAVVYLVCDGAHDGLLYLMQAANKLTVKLLSLQKSHVGILTLPWQGCMLVHLHVSLLNSHVRVVILNFL